MYVIMAATGHVGSGVTRALLQRGAKVTVITRDASKVGAAGAKGVDIVEADVNDADSLRSAFRRGRRAFLLNPPADTSEDTDAVERRTVASILKALEGSGLEKVVAESTYGAQAGDRIGDLNVLWELEEGLRRQTIPAAINRAAYYFSNWDSFIEGARRTGTLPSMIPANLRLPMVDPEDLGRAAADRLLSPISDVGVQYVEGPTPYSPDDVAAAMTQLFQRNVNVTVTPRGEWERAFRKLGFSAKAAHSYARMTAVSVDQRFTMPSNPLRGQQTLMDYLRRSIDTRTGRQAKRP